MWVSGRALCKISVGVWEVSVWGHWVCQGSLSAVSVDLSRSLCGVIEGPVLDQCGDVGGPSLGSVWICLGLCVGSLGALCWISVGMWEIHIWG